MKRGAVVLLALPWIASPAKAADVEVSGFFGLAMPTYDQTFTYDPGPITLSFPPFGTLTADQNGEFRADGSGGSSFGVAVALYVVPSFGFEARIDSTGLDAKTSGAAFRVSADLPPPLPDFSTEVDLGPGRFDIDRIHSLSLNLKVRTPGRVKVSLSGGVSYLPSVSAKAEQPIGLGVTGIKGLTSLEVGSLAFRAEAVPNEDDATQRIGFNAGAGVAVDIGDKLAFTFEGRGFIFPEHRLEWQPVIPGPLSALEEELLDRMRGELEPVEFNPTYYQATAGLTVRF